jgi:hypothetical protein
MSVLLLSGSSHAGRNALKRDRDIQACRANARLGRVDQRVMVARESYVGFITVKRVMR